MRRTPRRLLLLSAGAFVLMLGLLALLHTSWARQHVLRAALARIAPDGSVRVGALDYSLLSRHVVLHDVALLSPGATLPYFTADAIELRLPWRALRGELALDELIVRHPRFSVHIAADGSSNFTGESGGLPGPLPIERLELTDLQLDFDDARNQLAFQAGGLQLVIAPSAANSSLSQPQAAQLRFGAQGGSLRSEGGSIGWDGVAVLVRQLQLRGDLGTLALDGTINALDSRAHMDVEADIDVAEGARLSGNDVPLTGSIHAAGSIDSDSSGLRARFDLGADALSWEALTLRSVRGQLTVAESIQLRNLTAAFAGGSIGLDVDLPLDAGETVVDARWDGIELRRLAGDAGSTAPVPAGAHATGTLRASWPGMTPDAAAASADLRLRVEEAGAGSFAADLQASWRDGRLAGTYEVNVADLGALSVAAGGTADLHGSARVTGRVDGAPDALQVAGEIQVESLAWRDSQPLQAQAAFAAGPRRLRVADLVVTGAGASLGGDLSTDWRASGLQGALTLEVASLPELLAALPSDIRSTLPAAALAGAATAILRLSPAPLGTRIDQLELRVPGAQARASGILAHDLSRLEAIATVSIDDLALLTGVAELRDVRRVDAELGLGIDADSGATVVDLWSLDARLSATDVRLQAPARVSVDARGWTVEDLHLLAGPASVHVAGFLPYEAEGDGEREGDLRATATGDLENLDDLLALYWQQSDQAPPAPRLQGALQVDLRVGGSLAAPRPFGEIRLADGAMHYAPVGEISNVQLHAEVDGEALHLRQLHASVPGGRIDATATLPLAHLLEAGTSDRPPLQLEVELTADDAAVLQAWLPEGTLHSLLVGGRLRATATAMQLGAVDAELLLRELRFEARDVGFALAAPTTLRLQRGELSLPETRIGVVAGATQRQIAIAASARLDEDDPMSSTFSVRTSGSLDLHDLQAWLPAGYRVGGVTEFDLVVDGTPSEPRPRGELRVAGGSVAIESPRLLISELNGSLRLDGTQVSSDGISGRANGGDLLLTLQADLSDRERPQALLGLAARGVALEAAGLRAGADADLTLSARGRDELRLSGEVRVTDGGYRSTRSIAAELLGGLGGRSSAPATVEESAGSFGRLVYDIRIRTQEQIIVDTSYAELSLDADLRLVGSGSRPGLVGQLELSEGGQVFLSGNTYNVDRGVVALVDPAGIEPRLDIQASTRISQYDITLQISGPAASPSITVRSYPSLSEADIYSLMTTGRTLADARESGTQVLAEQAWSALTGQLQGAARSLGFNSLRFEQAQDAHNWRSLGEPDLFPRATDLAARLTITRSIGSRFELTYSQNLTETEDQSWIGAVRLPWNVQLRAGTYEDGSRVLEARHRLVFGAPWRVSGERREQPRVVATRFSGNPGLPEDRLLDALSLRQGKRFDFVQWRRDIDKLAELYAREDFLEARIRAVRHVPAGIDAATTTVTAVELEYDIERGPQTRLRFEGYAFDDSFVREARSLWQQSVAVEFLLADLQLLAARELVGLGYATARTSAVVVRQDDEVSEIVVHAAPGSRFGNVDLRIDGAAVLTAKELRSRLHDADLERAAWYAPDAVIAEVLAAYRQAGHPRAQITLLEPVFGADTATAVLHVEEGPPDRVATIAWHGLRAIDEQALRDAIALAPGDALDPGALTQATAAIAAEYLRRGYNSATIASRLRADTDGTHVLFDVAEGQQQVVGAIEVRGRRRTREGVVQNAIDLRVGEPLQLARLEESRRALLATEALQSAAVSIEPMVEASAGVESMRVVFTLQERALAELRYGVQLLSEVTGSATLEDERDTRPGISAILSHGNFLGVGATAALMGSYRIDEPFARASLSFPRLFGLPIRSMLVAQRYASTLTASDAFSVRQTVTRWLLEQRLERGPVQFGYTYSWEQSENEIVDSDFPFELQPITVTRLVPTVIWDVRDDRFEPRRGAFHSSTYDMALAGLGSEQQFHKYFGQQYVFVPVGPLVLATAVRFGVGASLDEQSVSLPASELFTVGGATTVRGYPDDALGRTGFFGAYFPGGDVALILNQEVRFPIGWWLRGVVFADGGSAFESLGELKLSDLYYSVGAGIRLATPYLTLRVDYGIRLNDVDYLPELSRGRFHFGIGHVF